MGYYLTLIYGNDTFFREDEEMIEDIEHILASEGFSRIKTNIEEVTLYTKYFTDNARAVQLFNCVDSFEFTKEHINSYDSRARNFLTSKGYEDVDVINIIVTPIVYKAKSMISDSVKCWIIDSDACRIRVYENQPSEFLGLRGKLAYMLFELKPLDEYDIYGNADSKYPSLGEAAKSVGADPSNILGSSQSSSNGSWSFGGSSSRQTSAYSITTANTVICIMNVLIFIYLSVLGSTEDVEFMLDKGAMFVPSIIANHEYYRFITAMFMHFGVSHIVGNMVVLMSLGDNVERAVGWVKYLIIYLGGGLIGNLGSFAFAYIYKRNVVSAGASGAIYALIGALLWIVVLNRGKLEDMTTSKIAIIIVYSLYSGLRSQNIDMAAHLFGLVGGFVIAVLIYKKTDI